MHKEIIESDLTSDEEINHAHEETKVSIDFQYSPWPCPPLGPPEERKERETK